MDANNCMNRDTVIVSSPQYTLQALAASKVIICTGSSDGLAVGSAAGGSPGYSYDVSGGIVTQYIDFSNNAWSGVCDKKTWANTNNIVWDGISNYNNC